MPGGFSSSSNHAMLAALRKRRSSLRHAGIRAAHDGMAERSQRLLQVEKRRVEQGIAAARAPHGDGADRSAVRARKRREALRPARVETQLVLGLARESPLRRGLVVREARVRDVGDRAALLARAKAEIHVFETVDERLVETAGLDEPLRAHRHRGARDGERVARRGNRAEDAGRLRQ